MSKRLLFLSLILVAAPAFADNCSGEWSSKNGANSTMDMADGSKVIFFSNTGDVSSKDTPYNGTGGCTGFVHDKGDGKVFVSATCVRTTAAGDAWGYMSIPDASGKRGQWRAIYGTGKLAKNSGSMGWWEVTQQDDKGAAGIWGGNCTGLN